MRYTFIKRIYPLIYFFGCSGSDDGVEECDLASCTVASVGYMRTSHSEAPSSSGYQTLRRSGSKLFSQYDEDDSDCSSDSSEWDEEEWPTEQPLPVPLYGCQRPELCFSSIPDYEEFLELVSQHLQECLALLPYDTISSFVQ